METMSISNAVKMLRKYQAPAIRRLGWPNGRYLRYNIGGPVDSSFEPLSTANGLSMDQINEQAIGQLLPQLMLCTTPSTVWGKGKVDVTPYQPSQRDILVDDWIKC